METTYQQDESDRELLGMIASGDTPSFETFYHRYEKRLYRYIGTLLPDESLAQDVLVETMLAVWKGAGDFRGSSRVSTWMFGIARHKALDAVRRFRRDRQESVPLDQIAEMPDPQDGPAADAERLSSAALMRRALDRLSKEHQEVIQLAFYEELSYEDIAALAGVPVNTVKTRVFYAKQHLKKVLASLSSSEALP